MSARAQLSVLLNAGVPCAAEFRWEQIKATSGVPPRERCGHRMVSNREECSAIKSRGV